MAKIKMKNSVTVAETFHDFLVGKKAAGVSEKTLLTYGQHFSAVSKHLSPDTPMDALNKAKLEDMISSMRDAGLAANSIMAIFSFSLPVLPPPLLLPQSFSVLMLLPLRPFSALLQAACRDLLLVRPCSVWQARRLLSGSYGSSFRCCG